MSAKKLTAVSVIFLLTSLGWVILGAATSNRTSSSFTGLKEEVASLYGSELLIRTPESYTLKPVIREEFVDGKIVERTVWEKDPFDLIQSDIKIDVSKDQRKKGNLWFPTFRAVFSGEYLFDVSGAAEGKEIYLFTSLYSTSSIYDSVVLEVNGTEYKDVSPLVRREAIRVTADEEGMVRLRVSYNCTGMERLSYAISQNQDISQVRNFTCTLTTDFTDIDFPTQAMSPTRKIEKEEGYTLIWRLENSVTAKDIGLIIPNRLNPGEIVTRVTFFAPVSLLFFFAVLIILSALSKVSLHPMHFAFLAASFFSFHLMYSYFSDHMNLYLTFGISSAISLLLTVTYLRLVTPGVIAYFIAPATQLVYLIVFSFSFFFDGTTGVIVTVCSVATLFILMQLTGGVNWEAVFDSRYDSLDEESVLS